MCEDRDLTLLNLKVNRGLFNQLVESNWCFKCGDKSMFVDIPTNLPGIPAKQCLFCDTVYQTNYLEDDSDMISLPFGSKLPELTVL